jgi:lipoyl(octanoyl) transferase
MAYRPALAIMEALVEARLRDEAPDTLLLVEHEHVLTLGRGADGTHVVASPERLAELGVEVVKTGRGGDVTYHGLGQLVAYPVIHLAPDRCDVRRYVRDLEEVMLRTAVDLGVPRERLSHGTGPDGGMTGLWVDASSPLPRKLGAIGVRISRWVTSHGLAFNVTTDLSYFGLIVPCGLKGRGVTSIAELTSTRPPLAEAETLLASHFAAVFDRRL